MIQSLGTTRLDIVDDVNEPTIFYFATSDEFIWRKAVMHE